MQRSDFRFLERLRVRWVEIDAQRIVFNGHYLMYFDTAVAGYWRALALPYHDTMRALEGDLYMRKATVEYHGSARYDQTLDIGIRCSNIGNSSIQFDGGVFRQDKLLVGGELVYVFADPATQSSRPVPAALREVLLAFEAGEQMLLVKTGPWADLAAHARAVRTVVFIDEQRIPPELEWDSVDAEAVHALAQNRMGTALGTARAFTDPNGDFRIGRVAVLDPLRNSGIGRKLLDALIEVGRVRGVRRVVLSAQVAAKDFYVRAGFAVTGEVYEDAGIAHVEMMRAL